MGRIEVLDTTLRDGAQCEGISFSLEDKLKAVRALDALGVDFIEVGNPGSNPKDMQLLRFLGERVTLKHAQVTAFGATCRAGQGAEQDDNLRAILDSGVRYASLFGKSALFHVRSVLKTTPEENLRMIRNSVQFLTSAGVTVFFDAEHFFDGYLDDAGYAMQTLRAACEGGAARLVLCDTNGGMLPDQIERITAQVVRAHPQLVTAIHCHNDAGMATASTLHAVQAGARQVQGTINGYGERCGNANLCAVLPNLALKLGYELLQPNSLSHLAQTARMISEVANLSMNERSPYVGNSAFAHKGGMHIDGVLKDSRSFEHVDPALVGNRRRFLVSEVAGRGAILSRMMALLPALRKDSEEARALVQAVKQWESEGYSFEDAEGSLELRAMDVLHRRHRYFEVLDFHVTSRKPEDSLNAQAYVKVAVDGQIEITADEGDGPINALDLALRKALTRFYPCLRDIRLVDFKVRVIDSSGTASKVRVHIESTNGARNWSTVGVSSNVIEASFIALTDSIEYMLWLRARLQKDAPAEGWEEQKTWAKSLL